MKVDLHVHSRERSACGRATDEEMVRSAVRYGLDGLAFTDHGRLVPQARIDELNRRFAPLRVWGGIEIEAEGEDVIVLGVQDPELESPGWAWPDLWRLVRQYDGYVALAHPFRTDSKIRIDIRSFPPDALEVHSFNIGLCDEARIRSVARSLKVRLLANSDAHVRQGVGIYYNLLARPVHTDRELIDALKAGDYTCQGAAKRLAKVNARGEKREREIRDLIAEGYGLDAYLARGGQAAHFQQVARGKSLRI